MHYLQLEGYSTIFSFYDMSRLGKYLNHNQKIKTYKIIYLKSSEILSLRRLKSEKNPKSGSQKISSLVIKKSNNFSDT